MTNMTLPDATATVAETQQIGSNVSSVISLVSNEDSQSRSRFLRWWTASSATMLHTVERKILSHLHCKYRSYYVDIGAVVGEQDRIWTIGLNIASKEVPLVLLHGLGAGLALWIWNFDALAAAKPVYAIDILGFGRSSRPNFVHGALQCEAQFVRSLEEWRRCMRINNMILLGHSMGGFIASSYALMHPERVRHLILVDPWGFPENYGDSSYLRRIPLLVRVYAMTPLNPFLLVRAAGPLGQWVVQKTRPDIIRKYAAAVGGDCELLCTYIHQCNAQTPTGESAFHTLMESFTQAKHPMCTRITSLRDDIPITFIYGGESWIDSACGHIVQQQRANSYVDIKIIPGAGHHLFADEPEIFNAHVNEICAKYHSQHNMTAENSASSVASASTRKRKLQASSAQNN